jgi:hypothetical protein
MSSLPRVCFAIFLLVGLTAIAVSQIPKETADKIDTTVALAYQVAAAKLPCKVSTSGRSRMLDWKNIDKCMAQARLRVNWEELASQLKQLRPANISEGDFASAVENSLSRQALPYNKVFRVKNAEALLPLTNSILKYAPEKALMDQPVFPQKGKQPIGVFAGVFFYERAGALATGNNYKLALFQYIDTQGKMQTPADKLLLDSYGVPWGKIEAQPGFRFPVDMLPGIGRK